VPNDSILKKLFYAALVAVAVAGCGGAETPDTEVPELHSEPELQVETEKRGIGFPFVMTCDMAEAIYDAVCDSYGNWSSQCTGAYDSLHCYCQNCSPPSA
jgi:hypothetical protein